MLSTGKLILMAVSLALTASVVQASPSAISLRLQCNNPAEPEIFSMSINGTSWSPSGSVFTTNLLALGYQLAIPGSKAGTPVILEGTRSPVQTRIVLGVLSKELGCDGQGIQEVALNSAVSVQEQDDREDSVCQWTVIDSKPDQFYHTQEVKLTLIDSSNMKQIPLSGTRFIWLGDQGCSN